MNTTIESILLSINEKRLNWHLKVYYIVRILILKTNEDRKNSEQQNVINTSRAAS